MNLLQSLMDRRAVDASAFLTEDGHLPGRTAAGVSVTHESAMRIIAVYAAVGLIADAIAAMPIHRVRRNTDGTRTRMDPPLWLSQDWQPNPETERYTYVQRFVSSVLLHGTGFSLITARDNLGFPSEVWNINPGEMRPDRSQGRLQYIWREDARLTPYTPMNPGGNLLVTKGFDMGGDLGLDPIRKVAAEAIGLAEAAEKYGASFFGRGSTMSGVITMPGNPQQGAIKTMRDNWERQHGGVSRAHRPGILVGGATWTPLTIPQNAAQFIETRRFQLNEIARLYRVPPHLISDVDRSTSWGTGIEEQGTSFVTYTLLPWILRAESAFSKTVPRGNRVKLDTAGLERGSLKQRYDAYAVGRNWGWLSINDVRALEDLNPIGTEGDVYHLPLNMVSADSEQIVEGPAVVKPAAVGSGNGGEGAGSDDNGE